MRIALFTCAAVVATGSYLPAHHSSIVEFDPAKPVRITGVVTKVEWQNPHIWFYVDVKDENGRVTNWGFTGGAPGILMRRGITKSVLKLGAVVVVEGFRARDGSSNATGGKVTFADGREVFTASAEDAGLGERR